MPIREWFQPPRRLLVLFLAVIVLPAAALGYFAWRTLEQDRALERQRVQENLDGAAALVAAGLHQRIDRLAAELEAKPEQLVDSLPADTLIAVVKDGGVAAFPKGRLLFWPPEPGVSPLPSAAFPEAEALEFRSQGYAAAAEAYRRAARSAQPDLRASALVGQARNLRKAGRVREALNVYDALGAMGDQPAGEAPAGLIARAARCGLLAQLADPLLPREASALHAELLSGRWRIDGASWEFHMGQIAQWLPPGETAEAPSAALAMAEAVATLPQLRRELKSRPDRGYRSLRVRDLPLLLAWDNQPEALTVLVGTMSLLESWEELRKHGNFSLVLTDEAGRPVWGGTEQRPGPKAFIAAADSGLPWNLRLASTEPLGDSEAFRARRGVMIGGLVVIGVLIVAGASLVARALVREMAVARMQADFVAAVSHEFRSPLTSMRHIVEMLEDGALAAESRRRQYYSVLAKETHRLHRLVENLLDFGRMEAGRTEHRFEEIDAAEFLEGVAAEFAAEPGLRDRLQTDFRAAGSRIRADREALARAVWNLLDNARKYSPDSEPIHFESAAEGGSVFIRVRDHGPGIPAEEQAALFQKFFRGRHAKESAVKGTGIGLAMVRHIVRAHGGEVRVESKPGHGSTFTIVLAGR